MAMDTPDKVRENKARRAAIRQGLELQKSRRRDPRALDYGGYMLVTLDTNAAVMGQSPYPFSATLDEIEDWLENPPDREDAN